MSRCGSVDAMAEVIGLSCRFPLSDTPSVLWSNLINGQDMVTESRWPGLYGNPHRGGVVMDFETFDAAFFSVHGKQHQKLDPQAKKLLEVGYEAWVDSGVAFTQLSGSDRVGVYVGIFGADALGTFTADPAQITGYEMAGAEPSMFPSRMSWWFNFRGPCKLIGTACSSSMACLEDAVKDIRLGRIDYAMVGGSLGHFFGSLFPAPPSPSLGCCPLRASAAPSMLKAMGYVRSDGVAGTPACTSLGPC
eukprot:jgi/Botrbrau1/12566/Bobra.0169s0101.1